MVYKSDKERFIKRRGIFDEDDEFDIFNNDKGNDSGSEPSEDEKDPLLLSLKHNAKNILEK
jgi:hypothetical protein